MMRLIDSASVCRSMYIIIVARKRRPQMAHFQAGGRELGSIVFRSHTRLAYRLFHASSVYAIRSGHAGRMSLRPRLPVPGQDFLQQVDNVRGKGAKDDFPFFCRGVPRVADVAGFGPVLGDPAAMSGLEATAGRD